MEELCLEHTLAPQALLLRFHLADLLMTIILPPSSHGNMTTWRLSTAQGFNWRFAIKTSVCLLFSVLIYFHCPVHTHKSNVKPKLNPINFLLKGRKKKMEKSVFPLILISDICVSPFTQEYTREFLKLSPIVLHTG